MSIEASGQFSLDLFPEAAIPAARQSPEQTVASPEAPVRMVRLQSALGTRATLESLSDKPHYELGGGVAEAVVEQDSDSLTPFTEFVEAYSPYKQEIAALFEQYRFPDITPDLLLDMSPKDRGKLCAHIVEYADQLQRRGRVLATDGTYGGLLAESYGFASEEACLAYGQELIDLSRVTKEQPIFTYIAASAQSFLDARVPIDAAGNRRPATAVSRRQFVTADTERNGTPQVTLSYSGTEQHLGLSYEKPAPR